MKNNQIKTLFYNSKLRKYYYTQKKKIFSKIYAMFENYKKRILYKNNKSFDLKQFQHHQIS